MTLRLRTFGTLLLERDGAPLAGSNAQRRRLALLAYLAAAGDAPVTRDKLIALLWPERDPERGRHSLSQLIYALRHDLHPELLVTGVHDIHLNGTLISTDLREFAECTWNGELVRAAELYRGPFLDGFFLDDAPEFERWLEGERARLHYAAGRVFEQMANRSAREGDRFAVAEWWRRRATLDPTDTRVVLQLMGALTAVGDRNAALHEARVHGSRVRHLLEVEPDPAIVRLADEIAGATAEPVEIPAHAATFAAATEVVDSPDATPTTSRQGRTRRYLAAGIVAVAFASTIAVVARSGPPEEIPPIVLLGDVDNPDSMLALAVREALRAEIANLQGIELVSDRRVRALKTLMGATSPPRRLLGDALLETAQRAGASAAVSSSIHRLGRGAVLVVEVLDPESGEPIGTASDRLDAIEDLLPSVVRVSRSLREILYSLGLDTSARPLPAVTTSSLSALTHFALARRAAGEGDRNQAILLAELALRDDSTFAAAHYLAGDLLWFVNQQTRAEYHLTRAVELSGRLPERERILMRARYEQVVRDRTDSAQAYWELLRLVARREPMAYEGMAWTLRALGRFQEAAAAANAAMELEPTALLPSLSNAVYALLSIGDTVGALAVATRGVGAGLGRYRDEVTFVSTLMRDPAAALTLAKEFTHPAGRARRIHEALLADGRIAEAERYVDTLEFLNKGVETHDVARAHLLQGWVESRSRTPAEHVVRHVKLAFAWLQAGDFSPPAVARLAERIVDLAARIGDSMTIDMTLALIDQRDRGRRLHSYEIARSTIAAASAYVRGDFILAAERAARARTGVYFSRSLSTVAILEADARSAAGDRAGARDVYGLVGGQTISDGDYETGAVLRAAIRREVGLRH